MPICDVGRRLSAGVGARAAARAVVRVGARDAACMTTVTMDERE